MYSNESRSEFYPTLSTEAGRLFFLRDDFYPEFMNQLDLLSCPADNTAPKLSEDTVTDVEKNFDDHSYWYATVAGKDAYDVFERYATEDISDDPVNQGYSSLHRSAYSVIIKKFPQKPLK